MKTFKEFLIEVTEKKPKVTIEDREKRQLFDKFKKNFDHCKQYLEKNKEALKGGKFLYRGIRNASEADVIKFTIQKTRKPLATDFYIHRKIGAWFKEKFGLNYREQSVFCQRMVDSNLKEYGDSFIIIPCGPVKYCFSPKVGDLTPVVDVQWSQVEYADLAPEPVIKRNLNKYLGSTTSPLIKSGICPEELLLSNLFFSLYWYQSDDWFESLSEITKGSLSSINLIPKIPEHILNNLFKEIERLMKVSNTNQSFSDFFMAYLGFRDINHLKETLVQIGEDWMNSLGYKETENQNDIFPLRNEVMVSCHSYLAIPHKYKKLLIEYFNENL